MRRKSAGDDDTYELSSEDGSIVSSAIQLLNKIARSVLAEPAQKVSIYKVLHILTRLPNRSSELNVEISLVGPRRWFDHGEKHEIYHWWTVQIEDNEISISSGGHFYRKSTGGDSFTSMSWSAMPGYAAEYSDYSYSLGIVDDAMPFEDEVENIDLSIPGYSLDITDYDNILLEDEEPEPEDDGDDDELDEPKEPEEENRLVELPLPTPAEEVLLARADDDEALRRSEWHVDPPEQCDYCHCDLGKKLCFIDGMERDSFMWGNMCADCFLEHGKAIRWGAGQLYKQQENGRWLMVAGFQ